MHISKLNVLKFENQGIEYVIGKSEEEIRSFYLKEKNLGSLEEYLICQIDNWHNLLVSCKVVDPVDLKVKLEDITLLDIAEEYYQYGYNNPFIIANSCSFE